ncbi:hypothetical protein LCGC14_2751420 [marine sediment metagenome]|uniref:Uncharacterized protein n=1 Tax=marine sediment metagenome TaxID=412755 RepID=A0A0F8Z1I6_9ZZZZ
MRNLTVKARIAFAKMNERAERIATGQHITLAGDQHIAEQCDVEDVTIHSDELSELECPDPNCFLNWGYYDEYSN